MEPLVQEIIAMDREAQQKVAALEAKRADSKKQAESKRTSIEAKARQDAEKRIDALKQQYEDEVTNAKQQTLSEYEKAVSKLHEKFQAKKEAWVKELVERCIHG